MWFTLGILSIISILIIAIEINKANNIDEDKINDYLDNSEDKHEPDDNSYKINVA